MPLDGGHDTVVAVCHRKPMSVRALPRLAKSILRSEHSRRASQR